MDYRIEASGRFRGLCAVFCLMCVHKHTVNDRPSEEQSLLCWFVSVVCFPGRFCPVFRLFQECCDHAVFYYRGQTPAESDFQVLEIARKLEMYGIRFHTASDREGAKINLAVSHMGVLVFQVGGRLCCGFLGLFYVCWEVLVAESVLDLEEELCGPSDPTSHPLEKLSSCPGLTVTGPTARRALSHVPLSF